MGTNFYYIPLGEEELHIGKRSAAGLYCWNCNVTLCKKGDAYIHRTRGKEEWYSQCPICQLEAKKEGLFSGSVGRELGFNKDSPKTKTGVTSCSSFTWASPPALLDCTLKNPFFYRIKDEYGIVYSLQEFKNVLKECPVQYYDSIGQEFS